MIGYTYKTLSNLFSFLKDPKSPAENGNKLETEEKKAIEEYDPWAISLRDSDDGPEWKGMWIKIHITLNSF